MVNEDLTRGSTTAAPAKLLLSLFRYQRQTHCIARSLTVPFHIFGRVAAAVFLMFAGAAQAADDRPWTVSKSSGEVWTVTAGAQPVSLSQEADLKPGDTIRTGRNGRVLLVRGEESILIAPNSAIGIPQRAADGMSTTIVQQAGSILLEVEKRNVQHFEVETPYLAAVVKGTQFRVSVGATGTSVNVLRGQVQVADFKSGQIAQVKPGQSATSFAQGKIGLALTGSGAFSPIEQGKPRPSSVERLMVPKTGLTAPRNAAAGTQVRTVGQITPSATVAATRATAAGPAAPVTAARTTVAAKPAAAPSVTPARAAGGIRIAAPIGDVRLNFSRVTNGLARGTTAPTSGRAVAARESTIWTARDGKPSSTTVTQGNNSDSSNATSSSNVAATSPGVAAAATPLAAASDNSGSASQSNASSNSNSGSNGNSSSANSGSSNNGHGNGAVGRGNGAQAGDNIGRPGNGRGPGNGPGNVNGPGPGNGAGPGNGRGPGAGPGPGLGNGNGNGPGNNGNSPGNGNNGNGPGNNGNGPGNGNNGNGPGNNGNGPGNGNNGNGNKP
jgi:hypothetical protein